MESFTWLLLMEKVGENPNGTSIVSENLGFLNHQEVLELIEAKSKNHNIESHTTISGLEIPVPSRQELLKHTAQYVGFLVDYSSDVVRDLYRMIDNIAKNKFDLKNRCDELRTVIKERVSNYGFFATKPYEYLLTISSEAHSHNYDYLVMFFNEDQIDLITSFFLYDSKFDESLESQFNHFKRFLGSRSLDGFRPHTLLVHLYRLYNFISEIESNSNKIYTQSINEELSTLEWVKSTGYKADFAEFVQVLSLMKVIFNTDENRLATRPEIQNALQKVFNIDVRDFRGTLSKRYNSQKGRRMFRDNIESEYVKYLNKLVDEAREDKDF